MAVEREVEILRRYIDDGEAVYMIDMACPGYPIYVIGPQRDKRHPNLDLDKCILNTLYRLVEGGEEDEVQEVLMAEEVDENDLKCFDEDGNPVKGLHRIDSRYGIFNFYPLSVEWVEDYEDEENLEVEKTA